MSSTAGTWPERAECLTGGVDWHRRYRPGGTSQESGHLQRQRTHHVRRSQWAAHTLNSIGRSDSVRMLYGLIFNTGALDLDTVVDEICLALQRRSECLSAPPTLLDMYPQSGG